ncbi:MAG: M24 family metallopeptidase [Flexilinea sp.]
MKTEINQLLTENNLNAIIISGSGKHNPPMAYFSRGAFFTRAHIFLIKDREPVLFYRPMERDTAAQTGMKRICYDVFPSEEFYSLSNGDLIKANALELQAMCKSVGLYQGRIAFCGRDEIGTQYALICEFQKIMPEIEVAGSEGIDIINQVRYVKDKSELDVIRHMGEIVSEVAGRVENYIKKGYLKDNILVDSDGKSITIGQVKRRINLWLGELGAENPEGTIFSMGKDAGVPHNQGNDDQVLEGGKSIVFDFFPCETGGGYFFDFTRTWSIGFATESVRKAYDQVKLVHDTVINSIQIGQPVKELQILTCRMFREMGHNTVAEDPKTLEGYVHSVSHGLGLNIHERPFTRNTVDNTDIVLPGTVFTIEPGLYYPDIQDGFGVRIEDTIFIDENGKPQYFIQYPYNLVLDVKTKQ